MPKAIRVPLTQQRRKYLSFKQDAISFLLGSVILSICIKSRFHKFPLELQFDQMCQSLLLRRYISFSVDRFRKGTYRYKICRRICQSRLSVLFLSFVFYYIDLWPWNIPSKMHTLQYSNAPTKHVAVFPHEDLSTN